VNFSYMKPLTLRKCLTCVHWQWQLRVQEALNLFVSVHLPSSNASSFVWHDLCCPHFAIKKPTFFTSKLSQTNNKLYQALYPGCFAAFKLSCYLSRNWELFSKTCF